MRNASLRFRRLSCAALAGIALACGESPSAPANSTPTPTPEPVSQPEFTITGPERAAMLEQGGMGVENVAVGGKVCDPLYPIASLTLNGTMVPVSGTDLCQSFNVNVASPWGLTIVSGEASNNRGRNSHFAQAFLRSPKYFPPSHTKNPAAKVSYGIVGNLRAEALDDNNRSTADDISTLLSFVANSANWNTSFPNTLRATPDANGDGLIDTYTYMCPLLPDQTNRLTGYRITRGTLGRGTVTVRSVAATTPPNALRITVTVPNVTLPVTVFGALDLGCVGELNVSASGTLRATSVTVALTEVISKDGVYYQDFNISASGVVVDVDFTGFTIIDNLVGGITTFLASALLNPGWLGQFVIGLLTPTLNDLIEGIVPDALVGALGGVQLAAERDTTAVPTGHEGVVFGHAVQAVADAARAGAAPAKGAVRSDGAAPKFGGPNKKPFGLAVKDDVVNQFFWAAWRRGGFDLASLSTLGCNGTVTGGSAAFATFALLPPVLMARTGDSVAVGLGDLRLTGTLDRSVVGGTGAPLAVTVYASGIAAGTVAVTASDALTIAFAPTSQVAIHIAAIDDSSAIAQVRTVLAPYFACIMQRVARTALEGFPVLAVEPGKGVPSVPPGTKWKVGSAEVVREGNYTTVRGNVKLGS